MKTLKISILLILAASFLAAQTATPSTTLCAAVKATDKSICLTAVTNVKNQTGVYVDNEFMTVNAGNNVTFTAGSYLPVNRGIRGGGPPAAHASGEVAWLAYTPDVAISGANGFVWGTQLGDVGTCTRTSEIYLPHIWVNKGVKRDCTTVGNWVDYEPVGPWQGGLQLLAASTATVPAASGNYVFTYSGVTAVTLVAPTATTMDGMIITFTSSTAYAHTVTCSGAIGTGGSQTGVLTFAAHPGASVTLMSYGGYWMIIANNLVTLTS